MEIVKLGYLGRHHVILKKKKKKRRGRAFSAIYSKYRHNLRYAEKRMHLNHLACLWCWWCSDGWKSGCNLRDAYTRVGHPSKRWMSGGATCCEEYNVSGLGEGNSQHEADASGSLARESFSLPFAGKFQGAPMGPVRFGIKKEPI